MKAVLLTNHGGPDMLRYGEAPDPVAGPGEVVVDIYAASVNAADYKVRLGGSRGGRLFSREEPGGPERTTSGNVRGLAIPVLHHRHHAAVPSL
jgi:NADPH:quinone reductase-like Zn-dependent oxidoreductase